MAGIISYGGYIPLWRLSRNMIAKGLPGEKAVASFDEDSITMAVAATTDCLKGLDRKSVDGLFFASTTSPYKEKLGAATIATAVDLRRDILVADFANSLRAGTMALRSAIDTVKAGSANQILVVAADCRLGLPKSEWEWKCGDGAAAVLVGDSFPISKVGAMYSVCDEILDVWRSEEDRFIRSSESRFVGTEGYVKVSKEALSGLLTKHNLNPKEFAKVAISLPEARWQVDLARSFGFDAKTQLQDSLLGALGDTGAAYSLILLVAALEEAKANNQILLVSYGNGSDAITFIVTEGIEEIRDRRGIKGSLQYKKMLPDYTTYLHWRGILPYQRPPYALGQVASTALWRERDQNLRLYGGRCRVCGTVQYPPQRVCIKCHAKEQFDAVRLSDKKGELVTYSIDYGSWSPQVPTITSIVNFEGGGRIECFLVDWDSLEQVKVGMPLEMSFRKQDYREGIHHYLWKSTPCRT